MSSCCALLVDENGSLIEIPEEGAAQLTNAATDNEIEKLTMVLESALGGSISPEGSFLMRHLILLLA